MQYFEQYCVQSTFVRRPENFVVSHFDERLQLQQPTKGLLWLVFFAGDKQWSVKEDSATLGQLSLISSGVDEDTS